MQESAYLRMCKVLASAFGLALAAFFYCLWILGAGLAGYLAGLMTGLFIFGVSIFAGVVMYLE